MPEKTPFNWYQFITIIIASFGFILSLMNTWRLFIKDRPRIIVKEFVAYPVYDGTISEDYYDVIEVINLSAYPLYITQTGYEIEKRFLGYFWKKNKGRRFVSLINNNYPRKIESRESHSFNQAKEQLNENFRFSRAYVKTACGETFFSPRKIK